ncbi:MAG: hypothetical protein Nk1A_4610 [Endomicrobiia bacterium]|nr:MAG: hypothetical protein Nk1A_4610 [Endomicrobiia bacterium]
MESMNVENYSQVGWIIYIIYGTICLACLWPFHFLADAFTEAWNELDR